jgi:hypothetical protein
VVCAEVDIVTAPLTLIAGAISVATSDNTRRCISGKGGCAGAVLEGALFAAGGAFGLGAMSRIAARSGAILERGAARSAEDILGALPKGRQDFVRTVPAEVTFNRLSKS